MTWDSANNRWQGSTTYLRIYGGSTSPSPGKDSVRVWEAPEAGSINITGAVSKLGLTAGNGVVALIYKNSTLLWSATVVPDTEATPTGLNNIVVREGDRIYFHINDNGDSNSDYTNWDPRVEFYPFFPATFNIHSASSASTVNIIASWFANYGISSRLQGRTNLVDGAWEDVGDTFEGAGKWITVTNDFTEATGFFRILYE